MSNFSEALLGASAREKSKRTSCPVRLYMVKISLTKSVYSLYFLIL